MNVFTGFPIRPRSYMDWIDGEDQRVPLSRLCSSYRDILKKNL